MDIMKVLFDQEVVTRSLLEAKYDEGRNEEKADVVRKGRLSGLSDDVLMGITGLSHEDMMKIH